MVELTCGNLFKFIGNLANLAPCARETVSIGAKNRIALRNNEQKT